MRTRRLTDGEVEEWEESWKEGTLELEGGRADIVIREAVVEVEEVGVEDEDEVVEVEVVDAIAEAEVVTSNEGATAVVVAGGV